MADIKSEIESLYKDKENKLSSNKVANFGYTDTAFNENDADGHTDYDYERENNIPSSDADTLQTNETVLQKGYQSQASSITRKLVNHFFGRVSYNLNKTVEVVNGLLSNLASYIGKANGLATLDENGRIPYSQLPESAIEIKGTWNASTNNPYLINGIGTKGDTYICTTEGYFNPETGKASSTSVSGYTHYFENDRIMYDDNDEWSRLPAGNIQSVNNVRPDSDNNVQITIKCTQAQYNAWSDKSGKFFVITDSSELDQSLINDNATASDTTWSSSKIDETKQDNFEQLEATTELSSDDELIINHDGTSYKGTLSDIIKAVTQSSITGGTGLPASDSAVNSALAKYAKLYAIEVDDVDNAISDNNYFTVYKTTFQAAGLPNNYTDYPANYWFILSLKTRSTIWVQIAISIANGVCIRSEINSYRTSWIKIL